MHPVVLPVLLQAVVGEVYVVIGGLRVVLTARGAQIAVSVVQQLVLGSAYRPDPYIELAPLEQQWPLHVFLNEPHRVHGLVLQHLLDFLHGPTNIDALALVEGRRLNKPHIFLAVLNRKLLLVAVAVLDLAEADVELPVLEVLHQGGDDKRGRDRVVDLVTGHHCCVVLQVEVAQGTHQAWLCGDLAVVFQVVVHHHAEAFGEELFHGVVGLC